MTKKYKTILIDPPWPINWKSSFAPKNKDIQYGTMSFEDIAALPIGSISAENCNLFIWTTHTWLPKTFELISIWGFRYHVQITWDKGGGLTVLGFHRRTEMCLYAYKGKMIWEIIGRSAETIIRNIPDLFESKANGHSKKPIQLYKIIEQKSPQPRLEIFARHKRAGWDVFGNEVQSDIDLLGEKGL